MAFNGTVMKFDGLLRTFTGSHGSAVDFHGTERHVNAMNMSHGRSKRLPMALP